MIGLTLYFAKKNNFSLEVNKMYTVFDIPVSQLPNNWFWRYECNGNGYLLSPYKRPLYAFTLNNDGKISYYDSENKCENIYPGSFADFRHFVEQKIINWLSKDEMIEFLEITPTQGNKIINHDLEHWCYLLQNRFYFKQDNQYIGIDNEYGFIQTEKFDNLNDCIDWIRHKEIIITEPNVLDFEKNYSHRYCGSIYYRDTYEKDFFEDVDDFKKNLSDALDSYGMFGVNFDGISSEAKKFAYEEVYSFFDIDSDTSNKCENNMEQQYESEL